MASRKPIAEPRAIATSTPCIRPPPAAGVSVFVSSGDAAAAGTDRGREVAIHGVNVSASPPRFTMSRSAARISATRAPAPPLLSGIPTNGAYYDSAKSYVPEIPWNDSCASQVLANYYGFQRGLRRFGALQQSRITGSTPTVAAEGPAVAPREPRLLPESVSGTCAGYAKPSWQSIYGNPSDGVRDLPDVALFAASGLWGHYYVFCIPMGGVAPARLPPGPEAAEPRLPRRSWPGFKP